MIPANNEELSRVYGDYILNQVKHLNRRAENTLDIVQSVWLRLLESDVIGKFHARNQKSRPDALTTEEVCQHLGISVDSWTVAQARYQTGDRTIPWMPTPVAGEPDSLDALWATEEIEQYEQTVFEHHEKVSDSENLIPRATEAKFRTYLQWAIHNAFANWCRTHHRRHKERAIDLFIRTQPDMEADGFDLFDIVSDTEAPSRRLCAAVEVEQTLEKFQLGDSREDFLTLLSDGYTAQEAAKKLKLSSAIRHRIQRAVTA